MFYMLKRLWDMRKQYSILIFGEILNYWVLDMEKNGILG